MQRVPPNEKRGRVHSSTVTVCVVDMDADASEGHPAARRRPEDFTLEWYSGSGSGGQHRNRHANCARLRHLPTGIVVTAQCRKRPESESQARKVMAERLDDLVLTHVAHDQNGDRYTQIGSGMRADKIRTYRFQDGRVVNHVTGRECGLKQVLRGDFTRIW